MEAIGYAFEQDGINPRLTTSLAFGLSLVPTPIYLAIRLFCTAASRYTNAVPASANSKNAMILDLFAPVAMQKNRST
jgi:hypothetical protein